MVDPLDRRSFDKPSPSLMHFFGIVKMVRHELNEFCKTLFFDSDLQKRKQAFVEIKRMGERYAATLKDITPEQKKELLSALQQDNKKIENAMKKISLNHYMEIDGIHLPILNKASNKAFTLFDFFSNDHMLYDQEVVFQYHAIKFKAKTLAKFLPGMDDPALQAEMTKGKRSHKHTLFNHAGIQYDIAPSNPAGSYNITGKCLYKEMAKNIKCEIPHGVMPGDLNTALDRILVQ